MGTKSIDNKFHGYLSINCQATMLWKWLSINFDVLVSLELNVRGHQKHKDSPSGDPK